MSRTRCLIRLKTSIQTEKVGWFGAIVRGCVGPTPRLAGQRGSLVSIFIG
jgi:hypothetical protein